MDGEQHNVMQTFTLERSAVTSSVATSAIGIVHRPGQIVSVRTTCTTGTDVACDIRKHARGVTAANGTSILANTAGDIFTADTIVMPALASNSNLYVVPGDTISIVPSGTLTSLVGGCINIEIMAV